MNEKYRIVVDAGHGGVDSGAVSGNLLEKDFNLQAANYMYNRFKELGVPVTITRDTDKTLSRSERLNTMRSLGTDPNVIVLSNHINAGGGEGAEVVYPLRTSPTLAKNILDEIGARGQIKRKIYQRVLPEDPRRDYYYIMRETPNTTALLIEYGFIDNPRDQVKLKNNLLDYAEGVVKAVSEYIGIPYSLPNTSEIGDIYTVKAGDTLYSIARKFNTTVNELSKINNLTSDILTIGMQLKLPTNEEQNEYETYTIKDGDSLYSIANKYNITVNDLIDYNALPSMVITVGDVIKIPKGKTPNTDNIYTVKPGDTLYRIANMYDVSIEELKNYNNLTSNILSIGQKLIIPTKPVTEEDYVVYEVMPGDTLYSIANRYNTKVDSIKSFNNLTSNLLNIGQILQIPLNSNTFLYQIYEIKPGDTLYSIAKKYNTTVSDIVALNDDLSSFLRVGQVIKIPR